MGQKGREKREGARAGLARSKLKRNSKFSSDRVVNEPWLYEALQLRKGSVIEPASVKLSFIFQIIK